VVKTFGVGDFSRLAVTDWRLRRWRLWFLALMTATRHSLFQKKNNLEFFGIENIEVLKPSSP